MAQKDQGGTIALARQYELYNSDEAIVLSATYANVLTFDAMHIRESTIQFKNDDGSIDMDYKIFATAKKAVVLSTADPEADDEWINLLSSGAYDHTTATEIPATLRAFETFTNPWRYIIVMAKADSGTPTLKIWHRGEY